jgi:hypothetical protein
MANLKLVADAIFTNKVKWSDVSDEEKESSFFIFNRYFAKKYPDKSQLLNLKNIDKKVGMDLWYNFFKNKPYPQWLWSKSESKEKSDLSEKDFKLLLEKLKIKDIDLNYLIKNHIDFIKEELKYYKSLEKEQ